MSSSRFALSSRQSVRPAMGFRRLSSLDQTLSRLAVFLGFWGGVLGFGTLAALLPAHAQTGRPASVVEAAQPPVAKAVPKRLEKHGHERVDDYYWLKERGDPEVIAYLEAENAYTEAVMAHTEKLQQTLFEEIVGRIKEDDETVPVKQGDFWYHERYVEGGEYPVYCRHRGSTTAPHETILDVNELARGREYCSVRGVRVTPDQGLLAYAMDTAGRRFYTLRFRELSRGKDLPDSIPNTTGNIAWANDNRTLLYTKQHPETLRWERVYAHVLGTDPRVDRLVFEEKDPEFSCFVSRSKSGRYIFIGSEQTLSTETRFLSADEPAGALKTFLPRETGHEYSIDHVGEEFVIRTNWRAKNFRIMKTPIASMARSSWSEVLPHRDDVFVEGVDVFRDHLVVSERRNGLLQLHVLPRSGAPGHVVDFGEPAYLAYPADNEEMNSQVLRYVYTSLTTPRSVFDYDMVTRERTLLKEEEVQGGFDKSHYQTERLLAPAADGALVPISLVYREGFRRDGSQPLLLYGYGSYGYSRDASFRAERLSLLDRGFVFAIAHVRGGQELGRDWYEQGKLMHKKNTFTDFIACARHLVAQRYTSPARLFAEGGSAGGLLMGAITNMAPDLFCGIVSHVPFVDVVTTMLEPDIPLTTSEYDEWGDPGEPAAFEYMLSYSPYDNIEAKRYPHILVTTGLHDSQVQYWEPAKYVAKLRARKTDDHRLLLQVDMGAGHSGTTGRFKRHRDTALTQAFLLDLAGKADTPVAGTAPATSAKRAR